jgi:hypothetical protein
LVIIFSSIKGLIEIFFKVLTVEGNSLFVPALVPFEWVLGIAIVALPIFLIYLFYRKKALTATWVSFALTLLWFFLTFKFFFIGLWSEAILCFFIGMYYVYFVVALTMKAPLDKPPVSPVD